MKENSKKIVLGQPLSGSLFAYFDKELNHGNHARAALHHPYYKTLYGKQFQENMDLVITLSLVAEDIIIAPADNPYPNTSKYQVGSKYYNPDFGLYFDWEESYQMMMSKQDKVRPVILSDKKILEILKSVPPSAHEQIVNETITEISLARKYDAPLFTMGRRQAIAKRIQEIDIASESVLDSGKNPVFIKSYLDLFGLLFNPIGLDEFYYLKASKELKTYSSSFYSFMMNFNETGNARPKLIEVMKHAIHSEAINKRLAGGFSATSDVMNYAGLIPILGTAASVIGIGTSLAGKGVGIYNKKNCWYELAPQVQRIKTLKKMEEQINLIENGFGDAAVKTVKLHHKKIE